VFGALERKKCREKGKTAKGMHTASVDARNDGNDDMRNLAYLHDAADPRVQEHIRQENAHAVRSLRPLRNTAKRLYREMLAATAKEQADVPFERHGRYYCARQTSEEAYATLHLCTASGRSCVLNPNRWNIAEFSIGCVQPSPDNRELLYTVDRHGREEYDLLVQPLVDGSQGQTLGRTCHTGVGARACWIGHALSYVRMDAAKRADRVFVGESVIYSEPDEHFEVEHRVTRLGRRIMVHSASERRS